MFTGIITDVGRVVEIERRGDLRLTIQTRFDLNSVAMGASIASNGVCLTVVEKLADAYKVDVSAETIAKTTVGDWVVGTPLNLERSLKLGDELGGHLVYGHVDGVGEVVSVTPDGDSHRWRFRVPQTLKRFIAAKGSVALNGVSLTVNEVDDDVFGVNIIPHTAEQTTFGLIGPGAKINLEVDMLARYVARLVGKDA
ncbi:riboflavin synthase [Niveispirillum cyanobacteriorum]|uniref:Riboflavin synthase n=1 Tax=Niveispirillum cyanobacteriorum TaxID=1612173 RepID=A0A2K9NJU7_9PROT|nr:riboflavin synthase [Niveispirillum cyanobacteriorum]AUN33352.1 riboflavin synthase [Niveispirillum cyanobacteriorum]GGE49450.1 riboflavin synthase subunit alpha [Niveispirillum cyanobacteriorum]